MYFDSQNIRQFNVVLQNWIGRRMVIGEFGKPVKSTCDVSTKRNPSPVWNGTVLAEIVKYGTDGLFSL